MRFELVAPYKPTGDQPSAIANLTDNLNKGHKNQVLLGVTGSGKTFTMANIIANVQRPTLVMAHNKTLAAQLFSEFREYFPNNAVQYFVSYYDYYQPEAYIPVSDTYIEKESTINQEIEKFRHASTHAILTRPDVIIVASVSCIYGLGSPEVYKQANIQIKLGDVLPRQSLLRRLTDIQYERNDVELKRGRFEVKGERIIIYPAYEDYQIRLTQYGNIIEKIELLDPITAISVNSLESIEIYPAKHYLANPESNKEILEEIEQDMWSQVERFKTQGKLLEAQRIQQRTLFDLEMIRETGSVSGIENYSRYFDKRLPGTPPSVLLDYFPDDYLLIVDESHITIPQVGGMYLGDKSRKQTLVDYGFRLPAAVDNRPLTFAEFEGRVGQTIYSSATPGKYELEKVRREMTLNPTGANLISEQLIRPTGLLDPEIEVRPPEGQIDDCLKEIGMRVKNGQRVLVTTLTKRMAEDLTQYMLEKGVKVQYLHSDVETMERSVILQDLRLGKYDVVVGINLLREGLDLPEVSLVLILDADKEGFLRSESALIQTIGRAARHLEGKVILYAERMTGSIERAISETNRRRAAQSKYNEENGITATSIRKAIKTQLPSSKDEESADIKSHYKRLSAREKQYYLEELREKMRQAALSLDFELAAELRDQVKELSKK